MALSHSNPNPNPNPKPNPNPNPNRKADISRLGAIRSRLGRRDFERVCRESKVLPLAFFLDKTESSHVSYKGYSLGSELTLTLTLTLTRGTTWGPIWRRPWPRCCSRRRTL